MANENKQVISAEVEPVFKETFKLWWRDNHYASEAEALRALARDAMFKQGYNLG
jgi:hypothetical protein